MASNTTLPKDLDPTSHYGYIPTLWICCTFLVLFAITTLLHLIQSLALRPRFYWIIPTTVMCGIGETLGWTGRLWSNKNPFNGDAYMMQLCTTIIAPTFLTAALYTILSLIISILGSQYSRLSAKKYIAVFVTADVVALVVQAAGGGMAATSNDVAQSKVGSNIMVAGIFLQLVGITFYTILAAEFLLRFHFQKPFSKPATGVPEIPLQSLTGDARKSFIPGAGPYNASSVDGRGVMPQRVALMVIGLVTATLFVYIRTIYRAVELLGGWHGYIIRTQVFFDVLDATPIVLAMFVLNIFAPGLLLSNVEMAEVAV